MALTDTACRNAKPKAAAYKLSDGQGLYLLVKPAGRYWRFDYRFAGKRKTLALGVYPDVSLASARKRCVDARQLLANEIDPGAERRQGKVAGRIAAANTFEAVAVAAD